MIEKKGHILQDDLDNLKNSIPSNASILSILDDKNKKIATLQSQLLNQKIQLKYYMKKRLRADTIIHFSQTCVPHAAEISMPINLAVNKFYKQMGYKSKIMILYTCMKAIDKKMTTSLQVQEDFLRKIVSLYCHFMRNANGVLLFNHFISNAEELELFNSLLNTTKSLRKELDLFRNCANRLIVVEDERNSLVEQVYSIPTEERMNCNYLIGVQMEKNQMEIELKKILKTQNCLKNQLIELSTMEIKFNELKDQIAGGSQDSYLNKMLKKVNCEAWNLLQKTEKRKNCKREIGLSTDTTNDNSVNLQRTLNYINLLFENNDVVHKGALSEVESKILELIQHHVENFKYKLETKHSFEMKTKSKENEYLMNQINVFSKEKEDLKSFAMQLKTDLDEIKLERNTEIIRLRTERDMYQSQVDDLQAIRAAYAQLVEKQPDIAAMERRFYVQIRDREKKITELEERNEGLQMESQYHKCFIDMQNKQINCLIKLIDEFNVGVLEVDIDKQVNYVETCSRNMRESGLKLDFPAESDSSFDSNPHHKLVSKIDWDAHYWLKQLSDVDEGQPFNIETLNKQITIPSQIFTSDSDVSQNLDAVLLEETNQRHENSLVNVSVHDDKSIKALEFHSIHIDGINTDVVKTTIQIDERVQSNMEIVDYDSYCLNVNCKQNYLNSIEELESEDYEYELLKDSSKETISKACLPCKKKDSTE